MSETLNLIIYIDPPVLNEGVANLTFARVVNNASKANVIFQSKSADELNAANTLSWQESYQIGAVIGDLNDGALIKSSTTRQDIVPGTVCDWTPVNGKAVRDMPAATAAPDDFPVGAFGTVNLPSKWRNTIWCATGSGGDYSCIYVDTDANATSGLNYRSYVVKNTFQLTWTTDAVSSSVKFEAWSKPFFFTLADGQTTQYLSWGRAQGGSGEARWWSYRSDPSCHDPSKAIVTLAADALSPTASSFGPAVGMRLGYDCNKALSPAGLAEYASKLATFMKASRPSYLDLQFSPEYGSVNALAKLDLTSPCYDLISGSSTEEKTLVALRSLLGGLSVAYIPLSAQIELMPTVAPKIGSPPTYTHFTAELTWTGSDDVNWENIRKNVKTELHIVDWTYVVSGITTKPGVPNTGYVAFTRSSGKTPDDAIADWNKCYGELSEKAHLTNGGITKWNNGDMVNGA